MAISLDDLANKQGFTLAEKGKVTFLPDPPRAPRRYTVISVDDHVVEPPHAFEGRLPAKFAEQAPRVVETDDGGESWLYDGELLPNVGFNAVVGRPVSEYSFEPTRFDQMRRGAWDIAARIADMDLNGVYGSLCFPSFLPGFTGQRLQLGKDPELALAAVRAWNDFMLEEWCGHEPGRMIPLQLPYLLDPAVAAEEVRRNAARGFKALTFSEAPHQLGLPSLHSGHWDPLMAALEETGTALCLHVGSSGTSPATSPDAPSDTIGVLFFGYAMFAAVDWLYSRIPVRFPDLRIVLSEGGIGWVAGLLDRLEHVRKYDSMYGTWNDVELSPADTFRRNFWVCAIDDPSAFVQRDVIGVENILVESDYPHADSTWPHTQEKLAVQLQGLPEADVERITWRNASEVFRHPVPEAVQRDPEAY
ncbi:MAG: amidohydrolase [Acidimicrobiales bacterium]|jgi:predicted TIM-barrel fold metal-dependent hydrolase|nr:amidohydrolase [Acidimicrobiales bacterium]